MTTFGIAMVKNEEDIIEGVLLHMAQEVDHLIVADNMSTDSTRGILDHYSRILSLTVLDDPDPAYSQSEKMSALAQKANSMGADWIVPFDADELWHAPEMRIKEYVEGSGAWIVSAELRNHYRTSGDLAHPDPFVMMEYLDPEPLRLPKVAFRYALGSVITDGNHEVRLPWQAKTVTGLQIRHFPYRSPEQFVRKVRQGYAALKLTDKPELMGSHWRQYGKLLEEEGPSALVELFKEHFFYDTSVSSELVHAPAPYRRFERWNRP